MRVLVTILLAAAVAGAQDSEGSSPEATAPATSAMVPQAPGSLLEGVEPRVHPLMNVEIVDKLGAKARLVAFHRVSGENLFVGYLGAADIEIPYGNVKSVRITAPEEPGGRMRAGFELQSGKEVAATFDEREGEQLFAGYADFGRVTIYWRDVRQLTFLARTKASDLPRFGKPTGGVDARLIDRDGVATELVAFRRGTGENVLAGLSGSMRVEVPLRIITKAQLRRTARSPLLECSLELKERKPLTLRLKRYEGDVAYRGRAEFGQLRIRLGDIRELLVHRATPSLRDLDPVAAAEGREIEIGTTPQR
jgi:hypothetical protein